MIAFKPEVQLSKDTKLKVQSPSYDNFENIDVK